MKKTFLVIGGQCFIGSNHYHVVKIFDCETHIFYFSKLTYGYDNQYLETASEFIKNYITHNDNFYIVAGGMYNVKRAKLENCSF